MKKILLLLISVTLFVGCQDLLDEIESAFSSFSATVSGNVSSTFSGEAYFINDMSSSTLAITLENSENAEESIILGIVLTNTGDAVPAGTYNADPTNQEVAVTLWYDSGDDGYIFPDYDKTNQVILSSVEENKVKGTFTFNVMNALGEAVSVTGSFDALGDTQ